MRGDLTFDVEQRPDTTRDHGRRGQDQVVAARDLGAQADRGEAAGDRNTDAEHRRIVPETGPGRRGWSPLATISAATVGPVAGFEFGVVRD